MNAHSRRSPLSPATLSLLVLAASCALACGGSDDLQQEVQTVEAFDTISVTDGFQVSITNGGGYKAILTADPDVLDDIVFTQTDTTIEVSCPSCSASDQPYNVQFTMPLVTGVTLTGATELTGRDVVFDEEVTLKVSDSSQLSLLSFNDFEDDEPQTISSLDLSCEDSSSCTLTVYSDALDISASDSSSVTLNGIGTELDLTLSDSSSVTADGLNAQDVSVDLSDASSASINATGNVTGDLTDASTLSVTGGATVDVDTDDDSSVTEN